MADSKKTKGEGDYAAAKRYRKDAEDFAQSHDTEDLAKQAKKDLEGKAGAELRRAEEAGKAKAREEDPKLKG